MIFRKKLDNRGDTIIEVMIVLAVLGLALSIAYATANKSLINTRQAQEYAEASAQVQSQIEQLRANSAIIDTSNPQYIYRASPTVFCINSDGNVITYPAGNVSDACTQGKNDLYALMINYDDTTDTFTVTATWDDVTGDDTNTLAMSYRLHKP